MKHLLACCKLYISESRNALALETIEQASKLYTTVPIINKFQDEAYNRVGYTLVSHANLNLSMEANPLRKAIFSMVEAAFGAIDLQSHSGSHPRIGVVDHICIHPLGQMSIDQAAHIAKSMASDIGNKLQVPTYVYGAAHPEGRPLDATRRDLGYFKPNYKGNKWSGSTIGESLQLKPDEGPAEVTPGKGVVLVGATKWVDNYNVPIFSPDITAVRRISRQVSERGGGLPSVQTMALSHNKGLTEVACNLLDPERVPANLVQAEVEKLARIDGMIVGSGYFTDLSQEETIQRYLNLGLTADES